MKVIVSIEHPSWVYQYKYVIKELQGRGDEVLVLAINKDRDIELLEKFGIKYEKIAGTTGKSFIEKAFLLVYTTVAAFFKCLKFRPDIFIGNASPLLAINAAIFQKKYIAFEDTEKNVESLFLCKLFAAEIITPECFTVDLGPKQVRLNTYKEISYLHPKYFQPNKDIFTKLGINDGEVYSVVRFVSWKASHDLGIKGFNDEQKIALVETLKKYGKVFISSEGEIPDKIKSYEFKLPADLLHNLLYYAKIVFTEGRTVASESAVLGTYSIYYNIATLGYTDDQEKKYGLVKNCNMKLYTPEQVIDICESTIKIDNLWFKGKEIAKQLIKEQEDYNDYLLKLLHNRTE